MTNLVAFEKVKKIVIKILDERNMNRSALQIEERGWILGRVLNRQVLGRQQSCKSRLFVKFGVQHMRPLYRNP